MVIFSSIKKVKPSHALKSLSDESRRAQLVHAHQTKPVRPLHVVCPSPDSVVDQQRRPHVQEASSVPLNTSSGGGCLCGSAFSTVCFQSETEPNCHQ